MKLIVTKEKNDNNDYIVKEINVNSLSNYLQTEPIAQVYKPNEENLAEDGLLETYVING